MNKRKIVVITIIVVALILIAVSSWLIYKKFFKKDTTDTDTETDTETKIITSSTTFPIKKGMSGSDVVAIQKAINKKCKKNISEDGKFGPNTESALLSCYGVLAVNETLFKEMSSGTGCPEGTYPAYGRCISLKTKSTESKGFKKGDVVYPRLLGPLYVSQSPSSGTWFGKIVVTDLSKPIGVYENESTEGYSKVWVNTSAIMEDGIRIKKAPYWAYIYTSGLKK